MWTIRARWSVIRAAIVLFQLFLLNGCVHVATAAPITAPTSIVLPSTVCDEARVVPEPSDKEDGTFVRRMVGSTVKITVFRTDGAKIGEYSGTGVVIGEKSILTARHVIRHAAAIIAQARTIEPDGRVTLDLPIIMTVVRESAVTDSAVLEPYIAGTKLPPPVQIDRCWKPDKGSAVWSFGKKSRWAWGYVNVPSVVITGASTTDIRVMRLAIACDFGDSGGPIVTPHGGLVGLITINETNEPTGGYAVPIANIEKELGLTHRAP